MAALDRADKLLYTLESQEGQNFLLYYECLCFLFAYYLELTNKRHIARFVHN